MDTLGSNVSPVPPKPEGVHISVTPISVDEDRGNVGLSQFERAMEAGNSEENRYMDSSYGQNARDLSARSALRTDELVPSFASFYGPHSPVDKTALNYGNLYGMQTSLHLTGNQFDWFASGARLDYNQTEDKASLTEPQFSSLSFLLTHRRVPDVQYSLGYLVGNYPDGWLLQHYHAGKVLSTMCTTLEDVALVLTKLWDELGLLRAPDLEHFFLGLVEAIVTPGLTILTSIWYSQSEVPLRAMIWYTFNGWSGILGGFVAYAIGTIPDPALPRWEYIFLILGSISVAFAVVLWLFFPDSPVEARFLNEDERVLAVKRVAEAKLGMKNTQFKAYQGMGFTTLQSTLLDAASNGVLVLSLVVAGWVCTRFENSNVTCIIAAACLAYLPTNRKWSRLVAYWFTSFQPLSPRHWQSISDSPQVGGFTKKTFTTALVFIGYCVGNVVGPQFLIESEAPIYQTGIKAMFIDALIQLVAIQGYVVKTGERETILLLHLGCAD
ncbi:hypothetical protein CERSUDRAFT_78016 [Gelatoporia subvermispora B]|uniref:Uncharacterized protein n=1 Tax=Ceriporiopsis subvermispora (strain B) TaxID=914234 RepID=M2P875_CERS8|nr:hypothetical protein CERSUDRAFT_78016 [Gelatoporia subvermispora B]